MYGSAGVPLPESGAEPAASTTVGGRVSSIQKHSSTLKNLFTFIRFPPSYPNMANSMLFIVMRRGIMLFSILKKASIEAF